MEEDIHSREEYIAILYSMLLSDGYIFANEINALYVISNSLSITNEQFLKIVNSYFPFDANKTVELIEKNKRLFRGNNRFILIRDLIIIIYSDAKQVRAEELLLEKICQCLNIDNELISLMSRLEMAKLDKDKMKIKEQENAIADYLIDKKLNYEIENILLQRK
jgi:uncharacterized tellurite resistance protein B-like protein